MRARKLTKILSIGMALGALGPAAASAQSPLEQDLAQIMAWWPGAYNNDRQVAEVEARMGEENFTGEVWRIDNSGMGGYLNVTSHYIRLDAPAIGDNVLYVEEFRDGQPGETYRQRIYTLSVDDEEQVIRVNLATFKDREKYVGAYRDIALLDGLTAEEITFFPRSAISSWSSAATAITCACEPTPAPSEARPSAMKPSSPGMPSGSATRSCASRTTPSS